MDEFHGELRRQLLWVFVFAKAVNVFVFFPRSAQASRFEVEKRIRFRGNGGAPEPGV